MTRTAISPRLAIRIFVRGLVDTSDNVGLMDTPFATSNDENLPGEPIFGEKIGKFPESWQVRWLATTGSTNDDLLAAGRAGAPDRVALVTDYQSKGRGRLDRTWVAPQGVNLLVSLLLRQVPRFPHALTHAVALAAAAASETVVSAAGGKVKVDVKWPNDLLVDGQKTYTELYAGAWIRNNDAVIPYLGIEWNSLRAGFSYDINYSKRKAASAMYQSAEISLNWIFNMEEGALTVKCPKF